MRISMFSALISEKREPGLESESNPRLDLLSPCLELQHGAHATENCILQLTEIALGPLQFRGRDWVT